MQVRYHDPRMPRHCTPSRRLPTAAWVLPMSLGLLGCPDYTVTRLGEVETFDQNDGNLSVDFLWVMDNSGTMSEEQEVVVAGLGVFIDVLDGFGADWQVGVTTTDIVSENAGHLTSAPLTPLDADIETAFATALQVGTTGSVTEAGLQAMVLATSEPLRSGANAGFLREGSGFSVVVVADEDDHSPGQVADYQAHLDTLKGPNGSRLSAVVGDLPAGCATPYAAADPGERYRQLATDTAGYQDTICRRDFTSTMGGLALNGLGLTDTFPLAIVPELTNLTVTVDGVQMYQRVENGWQYDPGQNAIIFDGYAIPGPNAEIVVEYFAWQGTELVEE